MTAPRIGSVADHAAASESLAALALGALDPAERAAVLAHAAGCPSCAAELSALREAAAGLAHAAPAAGADDAARRAAVRERLMGRAADEAGARRAGVVAPAAGPDYVPPLVVERGGAPSRAAETATVRAPRVARWPLLALAASLLVALSLGARAASVARERDALRTALASSVGTARREAEALRTKLDERERTLASLTGRDVRVVELVAQGPTSPWARMFWDRGRNQWVMFAGNLPASAAGRTYELWLISGGKKIAAGTFEPDARGEAVVRATYAIASDALQAVAVTAEPAGGVEVPTGPVVIAGAAR